MYRLLLCVFSLFLIPTQAPAAEEVINERIEWSDVWIVNADSDTLPRVLLVGDSIVKGYYNGLEKALEGKANWHQFYPMRSLRNAEHLFAVKRSGGSGIASVDNHPCVYRSPWKIEVTRFRALICPRLRIGTSRKQ